ncbi:MAG: type II toxin-antitoxin system VapC family toxin [Candidatus Nanohaloarchaea archaeon]
MDKDVELAEKNGITVYDSSFLALAELLDARLVTTDQELFRKTEDSGSTEKLGAYVEELEAETEDKS